MADFNKCPRWFFIRHVRGLRPKGESAALQFGSALHNGLAVWYKTKEKDAALDAVEQSSYIEIPGEYRTKGLVAITLHEYWEQYGEDKNWDIVLNESAFDLTDDEGFRWGGRLDLGVRWNKRIWIVDHKSTSMGGPSWWNEFETAPQMAGYSWAGGKLHGERIAGVIINRIVVRRSGTSEFDRRPFRWEPWKLEEWRDARIRDYNKLAECFETGDFPPNHYSCITRYGKCPAHGVCTAPPKARETILDFDFVEDRWDWSEE